MEKAQILSATAYGHSIEVTFTKVVGTKLSNRVPNSVMCKIVHDLKQMETSGQFDIYKYTTDDSAPYYIGTWRVVPVIDYNFMLRIAYWVSSYGMDEGLSEELFNETYGTVMGKHYYGKWENLFHHNIMKMIAYFGLDTEEGMRFCGMVQQQMTRYEARIKRKHNG